MSRHKCLMFSLMSHYHVMWRHKCLIFSTYVTVMSWHVTNVWYTGLMSHSHVMSQISDIQYPCHTVISCRGLSQICNIQCSWYTVMTVTSQMFEIKHSWNTLILCHEYLISSNHITQSCHATNVRYSVLMSQRYVMSCHKYLIFSTHVKQSCHDPNVWYSVLRSHSNIMSFHKWLIFSIHVIQSWYATNVWY